jgi:hypothetical protein
MSRPIAAKELLSLVAVALLPALILGGFALVATRPAEAAWVFLLTLKVSIAFAVVVGLPTIWLFDRLGLNRLRHYLLVGLAISLLLAAIFIYPSLAADPERLGVVPHILQYGVLLVFSLAATGIYWLIARPDRVATR